MIRRELTENIIGLFYDVLVEELEAETNGKSSDTLKVPDDLKAFYAMENIENRPIDPESILSKCRYLLRHYNGPSDYPDAFGRYKTVEHTLTDIELFLMDQDKQKFDEILNNLNN